MSHKRCQERHPTKFATMSKNGLSYFTHGESPKPWTAQNALTWKGNQFIQHYHMLHFQNFLSYLYCGCNEMTMIMEIIMTTKTRILPLSQKMTAGSLYSEIDNREICTSIHTLVFLLELTEDNTRPAKSPQTRSCQIRPCNGRQRMVLFASAVGPICCKLQIVTSTEWHTMSWKILITQWQNLFWYGTLQWTKDLWK